jgi:hypothetical protein
MDSKPFWKSRLFLTALGMFAVAAFDAWQEGGDLNAIILAGFGALVVIFRKLTTQGMVFSFKEPRSWKEGSIFADVDRERDDDPTGKVKIVPNGDKSESN